MGDCEAGRVWKGGRRKIRVRLEGKTASENVFGVEKNGSKDEAEGWVED